MAHFRRKIEDVQKNIAASGSMDFAGSSENIDDTTIPPGGPFAESNFVFRLSYAASSLCFQPWVLALDGFLSLFIDTTDENETRGSLVVFILKGFCFFIVLLCLTPLVIVATIVWCPLQVCRPRAFSYISPASHVRSSGEKYKRIVTEETHIQPTSSLPRRNGNNFSVVSANICLMPEFIAHINNLHHSVDRGRKIADYFTGKTAYTSRNNSYRGNQGGAYAETDFLFSPWSNEGLNTNTNASESCDGSGADSRSVASTLWSVCSKENCVSETIPGPADFICFQEVFDDRATKQLIDGLRNKYPYIIYDVSWPLHDRRISLLGSGLCIASKFPFIDVMFKAFPDGHRDDKAACKGLLMTKLYLGPDGSGADQVGYLATTHLQAWSHSSASSVRCKQLNNIVKWMEEFAAHSRSRRKSPQEVVLFNVITGDFNFDKVSHYDNLERQCNFFDTYLDHCMDATSGQQHSWVVGTELKQMTLHNPPVATPQGLQRMLVSELERPQYVASTMSNKFTSLSGTGDGKRRIDYILYKPCQYFNLEVKDYKFFTGLATLSDHIPIGMMFSCERNPS